jgi:uncharacterized protein YndB with AHSA1/START domain
MVRVILLAIAAVIVLVVLVVATRPSTFHIERSITIAAPPENAFARVNDFHAWAAWSPYERLDPQMTRTFGGAASGTGATYAWTGNDEVGEGRMTIEKSDAPSRVSIKLEFFRPWVATNVATFTFAPVPEGTKVTWAMDGQNNFGAKAASLFMDIERIVGGDFERGLAGLKTVAENASQPNAGVANAVE